MFFMGFLSFWVADCAEAIPGTVMTVARATTIQVFTFFPVFTVFELRCIGVLLVSRFSACVRRRELRPRRARRCQPASLNALPLHRLIEGGEADEHVDRARDGRHR